jgi:hypothetical protein
MTRLALVREIENKKAAGLCNTGGFFAERKA